MSYSYHNNINVFMYFHINLACSKLKMFCPQCNILVAQELGLGKQNEFVRHQTRCHGSSWVLGVTRYKSQCTQHKCHLKVFNLRNMFTKYEHRADQTSQDILKFIHTYNKTDLHVKQDTPTSMFDPGAREFKSISYKIFNWT